MGKFYKWREATGEIVMVGNVPAGREAQQAEPGFAVVAGVEADQLTEWHGPEGKAARPKLRDSDIAAIAADGVDALVIADIPAGTGVEHAGATSTINDGTLEFSTTIPGTYSIRLLPPFPLREQVVTVVAS